MLEILTCDAPALLAALRNGFFRRAGLNVTSYATVDELVVQAAAIRPDVVIVEDGDESDARVAGLVKGTRKRPILLLAVSQIRREIDGDLGIFDGIVALDDPELDLARALSPLVAFPKRDGTRRRVQIPVLVLASDEEPVRGFALDLAQGGAGLVLPHAPAEDPYHVVFHRSDGRLVVLGARTTAVDALQPHSVRVGVRFINLTLDARRTLRDLAFWEVADEPGMTVIVLHGELSEASDLSPLLARLENGIILDFADVTRVNSAGVVRWVELLQKLPPYYELRLRRLSVWVARQMVLVPAMTRRCVIESFYVPFECAECQTESIQLVQSDAPVQHRCPTCAKPMLAAEPLMALAQRSHDVPAN